MSSKSISTLALLITANASQLAGEFNRVDNIVSRSTMKWQRGLSGGLKMGIGISGAQAALSVINNEIRHVIANIESIPGIPATAVASIVEARGEFQAFRNSVDYGLAKLLEWGRLAAQSVGAGLAMITNNASGEDVRQSLGRLPTPDEIARARDPGFDDKVRNAASRFSGMQTVEARKNLTPAAQYQELIAESERLKTFAGSGNNNSLQKAEAMIKAQERLADANDIYRKAQDASNQALQRWTETQVKASLTGMSHKDAIQKLQTEIGALKHDLETLNAQMMANGKADIEMLERRTQLYDQLRQKQEQLIPLMEEQRRKLEELGRMINETIADGFARAALEGEKFTDVLKEIGKEILKLLIKKLIIDPLVNWMTGGIGSWFSSAAGGSVTGGGAVLGFANGGEPPVGRASIVGERGPELFVPKIPGTVITNSSLKEMALGRRATGNSYVFNLPGGVSESTFQQFAAVVKSALGPGVIERRAINAVYDHRARTPY